MAIKELPTWLKPGVPVCHRPTGNLFIAYRCIRRRDRTIALIDAPKGFQGNEYALEECQKPELSHLRAGLLTVAGEPLTIIATDNLLIVSDGKKQVGVRLAQLKPNDVVEAAQSLAQFFEGAIAYGVEVQDANGA